MCWKRERGAASSRHKIQNNGTAYLNYCLLQTDEWFHFIFDRTDIRAIYGAARTVTSNTTDCVCSISKNVCNLAAVAGVLDRTRYSPIVDHAIMHIVAMEYKFNQLICVRAIGPNQWTTLLRLNSMGCWRDGRKNESNQINYTQ